jgi:hypothetical protein
MMLMIDSTSPTWANCLNGQKNLHDAIRYAPLAFMTEEVADSKTRNRLHKQRKGVQAY